MALMEMSAGGSLRGVWRTLGTSEEGSDLCPRYNELGKGIMAESGCEMRVAEHTNSKYTDLLKLKSTCKNREEGAVVCVRKYLKK